MFFYPCLLGFSPRHPEYTQSISPPNTPYSYLIFRDGSNNIEYICRALSRQPSFDWRVSDTTLTSIVVSSNTATVTTASAHGLAVGNQVSVFGSAVAALNGGYQVATVGATTFTFTTSGVSDATYNNAELGVGTTAPRSNASIWSIQKFFYTTSLIDRFGWADSSTSTNKSCSDRTTYAYN